MDNEQKASFDLGPSFGDGEDMLSHFAYDPRFHSKHYEPTQADRDETEILCQLTEDSIKRDFVQLATDPLQQVSASEEPPQAAKDNSPASLNNTTSVPATPLDSHTTSGDFELLTEDDFDIGIKFSSGDECGLDCTWNYFDCVKEQDKDPAERAARFAEMVREDFAREVLEAHERELIAEKHAGAQLAPNSKSSLLPFDLEKRAGVFDEEKLAPNEHDRDQRRDFIARRGHLIARVSWGTWTMCLISFVAGLLTILAWQWVYHGSRPRF